MKAKVDKVTCIGCALCSGIADDIFKMDYDEGKAEAIEGVEIGPKNKAKAKDAEQNCPVGAITVA